MEQSEQQISLYLQRISNILLINGGFLDNPGLYFGETGLALFFFNYSNLTQNELYAEYGYELIEKMQSNITGETPVNYRHGLTGIGSAFEYLVQFGLIEADTDDVLEEFDNQVFSTDKLPNLTFDELHDTSLMLFGGCRAIAIERI